MPGSTDNSVVIDAPMDLVWSMTNDVESWPGLFTEYAATEVISTDGPTSRIRLTTHPDEQGRSWSWVSDRTIDPDGQSVRAHRVETGPFEYMELEWTYQQTDAGVEMRWRQNFAMNPDAPFDDDQMTDRINTNTRIQMDVIKQRLEQAARA